MPNHAKTCYIEYMGYEVEDYKTLKARNAVALIERIMSAYDLKSPDDVPTYVSQYLMNILSPYQVALISEYFGRKLC